MFTALKWATTSVFLTASVIAFAADDEDVVTNPTNPMVHPSSVDHSLTPPPTTTTALDPLEKFQKEVGEEFGDSSTEIRHAQQQLNSKGFKVSADGRMGPETAKAIRSLQAKNGLRTTGILDDETIKVLNK